MTREPFGSLPAAHRVLARIPTESLYERTSAGAAGSWPFCRPLLATAIDTLLTTRDGRAVALELRFAGGGMVLLLADVAYVTNRALKETDAAIAVVPWLLAVPTRLVIFDEYHLGLGDGGSLWSASGQWLRRSPGGWAILQLLAVSLVGLATGAVRFGPALSVIERRRRSALEHLEALAAGLEGTSGIETAVGLIVAGLRRRLSRSGYVMRANTRQWLIALELASPTPRSRSAVRRLQHLTIHPGGPERVLAAAQAVEDVWEELHPRMTPVAS